MLCEIIVDWLPTQVTPNTTTRFPESQDYVDHPGIFLIRSIKPSLSLRHGEAASDS